MTLGAPGDEGARAALFVSVACLIGSLLTLVLLRELRLPANGWPLIGALGAGATALLLAKPRLTRSLSLSLIALQTLAVLAGVWEITEELAASGRPFVPFNGTKVIVLVVAIFCPSMWLGALLIALTGVQAVVQSARWPADVQQRMAELEPWATLVFDVAALALVAARRRHAAILRELAETQALQTWLERGARLCQFVRELTREPIETLRAGLSQIRREDLRSIVELLGRAVTRLEQLNEALAPLDMLSAKRPEHVDFDAVAALNQELRDHPLAVPQLRRAASTLRGEAAHDPYPKDEAWRASVYLAAGLTLSAAAATVMAWANGYPSTWWGIGTAVGLAILVVTLAVPRLSDRVYLALFSLAALVATSVILVNNDMLAHRGGPFDAFAGIKIGALIFAFLAPSIRLGAAIILAASLSLLGEVYLWWSPSERSRMPMLEPWVTVFFCFAALVVLVVRRRHVVAAERLAREQAQSRWLAHLARLAIAVRDFSNSPLQTIRLSRGIVEQREARARSLLDAMDGALARLEKLNDALTPLNAIVEWKADDLSFDAMQAIEAEVRGACSKPARIRVLRPRDRPRSRLARWGGRPRGRPIAGG